MRRIKAFTLIELLVVVAIIALLLSIIVPAVRMAKRKAGAAVCLTNVKNFSLAWYAYQGENDGKLMNPDPGPNSWVDHPFREDGTYCDAWAVSPPVTDEDEKRGIARGLMYTWGSIDNFDVYHCPVDMRRSKRDQTSILRSYAIAACLGKSIRKFHEITQPAIRYNFVEEADGRNFNEGTWDFYTSKDPKGRGFAFWRDPISVSHGFGSVLGFCDGHAEVHQWVDPQTRLRLTYYMERGDINGYGYEGGLNQAFQRDSTQVTDTEYMERGRAYRR